MSNGNRIFTKRVLPKPEVIEALRNIPTANIADVMNRIVAMNPRIKLVSHATKSMAGVALTVKTRSGDNLLLHRALDMACEGDVIVVSGDGCNNRALMGEIMMVHLSSTRKAEGIVLDAPIRDKDSISQMDFPVYATGFTPNGPYKEGPGEINVPVSCGDVSVFPGDIIIGDMDGIVVIPCEEGEVVLKAAREYHKTDAEKCEKAKLGTANREWVGRTIAEKNIEIIESTYIDYQYR